MFFNLNIGLYNFFSKIFFFNVFLVTSKKFYFNIKVLFINFKLSFNYKLVTLHLSKYNKLQLKFKKKSYSCFKNAKVKINKYFLY